MKQLLLNWLLKDVIRFEVVNHNNSKYDVGRVIIHKDKIETSLQDNDKTLKIFI